MNDSRLEFKVGLFVAVGLALIALLILNFSRGVTLFERTYNLHIIMPTAAGLKPAADVMLYGVSIGKVSRVTLGPKGKDVDVSVRVLAKYKISKDSVFHVDALGFLGDQYIDVSPPPPGAAPATNAAGFFHDGDTVVLRDVPFNMQEAARSTAGLLEQAKLTMKDIDQAVLNVNRTVLSDQTLTNFSLTLSNLQFLTEVAGRAAQSAEDLLRCNSPPITATASNIRAFSQKLNVVAADFDQVILTNRLGVSDTVKNLRDTSAALKQLTAGLQAGQGLAGGLLKDPEMKIQLSSLLSNANAMTAAFGAFGSNLDRYGLWHMLWKPKAAERTLDPPR